jgi:hypothetical protein
LSNSWFRFYHEFATDPVSQLLSHAEQRHYIIILCLKCNGVLDRKLSPKNRESIIKKALNISDAEFIETKNKLIEVDYIDDTWQPVKWDKRQYKSDNSTERSRKSRINKESKDVARTNPYVSAYDSVNSNINKEALEEFKQHRRDIKKPLSEMAIKKNIKVLEGCSHEEQQRIVDTTIANRWSGLFPLKDKKQSTGKIGRAIDAFRETK